MNNQKSQNQVSIIINGVRYDAVKFDKSVHQCELCECVGVCFKLGACPLPSDYFFKKSDKKFEP